ncbi:hypothetical protein M8494_30930 [Serratia ureilytica]
MSTSKLFDFGGISNITASLAAYRFSLSGDAPTIAMLTSPCLSASTTVWATRCRSITAT